MAVDNERIAAFIGESPLRQQVASVLQRAGFLIVWVFEEANGSRWGLYLKLPPTLKELFGTGREVLFWVVQSADFQARTITQADSHIRKNRPRLCEDFAIVATHDKSTAEHAAETASTLSTIFVGFNLDHFKEYEPWGPRSFVRELQAQLYSHDLYDLPGAVTRSEDFFGRREIVTEIASRLRQGSRHVGLFGLRKIGKTSLLYRLKSTLLNVDNVYVTHIDIERLDAINATAEYLIWSLGESIYDAHRHMRRITGLLLFGKYRIFTEVDDKASVFELFDHDLRKVLSSTKRPIVVLLDEIELLSPDLPGSKWGGAFVRVWRLLRGIDQQFPGRISYFTTGTNASIFESNFVGGQENPAYNYVSVEYLKPLHREDVSKLLVGLGSRIGLTWDEKSTSRVFDATGGHPALVRSLASLIHRTNRSFESVKTITSDDVDLAIKNFLNERSSLLGQIVTVLDEQYPDEYLLLEFLATGRVAEFRQYAAEFPSDVAHLLGYGICTDPNSSRRLEIELLQTFIQRRERSKALAATGTVGLPPGSMIDEYKIVSSIGHVGGYSTVYAADTPIGSTVAVKVFRSGLLSILQRELEPLQEISHPNVVKVLDYGKTADGLVYMVTEYLEGDSLRAYCTRSTRASERVVASWLAQLLSAMVSFHPNDAKVQRLRSADELSVDDLGDLEEARHGFVHRDIKPENIIASNRGVVLIDFNISSQASMPVITESGTLGYQPPDGAGVRWTPDVDLYQLGITMLQVSLGIEFTGDNVEDIRTLANEELSSQLGRILLKMTAPSRAQRYANADGALGAVRALQM
ncbi:serine/threonine-protein kinase [Amycolatopsis sp. FDAARGOS 1241]|uniref:serine/threonine-protein kinase n=1 Tax=Amycolatopsis sp. FDAARGOS 1241 TaxID=2778070 RepID=UPI001950753E|nr:protein kinase [Amycolatopsis sp. FDAARGOS 1241]QRP48084.1 protein kinase [Amycolatopsis sp. FDAARGOS 1241]